MTIETLRQCGTKLYSSNKAGTSFTAVSTSVNEPNGDGIFIPTPKQGPSASNIAFCFFGSGSNNQTFTARISGWKRIGTLWVAMPLLALSGTLGAATGAAGKDATATDLFADTLTASAAYTANYQLISPADDTIAWAIVDGLGCDRFQVQVAKAANDMNCLAASF